ncbi:MAG: iron ABC transporter substrate-binding protein [Candidatus Merdisoma sp.]
MKKRKALACLLALGMLAGAAGCGQSAQNGDTAAEDTQSAETDAAETAAGTRLITDSEGREVEIPEKVESIVCLNVGALRYTCYMQAQDLVIGVEDYEKEQSISRGYNYVNFELFQDLPVVGNNGEHYPEEIISADPDVIVMSAYDDSDADSLQEKTGIPVVVVPGSDSMMDEGAYETFRIMGELYGKEDRAQELLDYMDSIKEDLETRTADVAEEDKLTAYVAGVSYKGAHGFEGTEAGYGPFAAINAKNLADETGQTGPFDIDLEQVLAWDPDVIFVDFNGLNLVNEDYASNPEYYEQLTAVQEGRVYSQISFRSSASNLDTALADTYYAASVLYPEQFADVDPEEKAAEIFEMLLGENFYEDLKANGYEFRQITIGE